MLVFKLTECIVSHTLSEILTQLGTIVMYML